MKKITLLFICFLLSLPVLHAQDFPCGDHTNWDWTQQASYDYAYVSGRGKIPISSPFHSESSANNELINIIRGKDYLPQEGWVLLQKVFGCPEQYSQTEYPFFVLYNKFRGIVRYYVFNSTGFQFDKATAVISWGTPNIPTSLFSPSEVYLWTSQEYADGKVKTGNIVNYIKDYYSSAWFTTEYTVAFDEKLDLSNYYTLDFKLYSSIDSDIKMNGNFEFTTTTVTTNSKSSGGNFYDFAKDGQKFYSNFLNANVVDQQLNGIIKGLDTTKYEAHKQLARDLSELSRNFNNGKLADILNNIGAGASLFNGAIGLGISIFDTFIGKSNKAAIQTVRIMPTVSTGVMELSGSISTVTNAARFNLQLPGSNHLYGDGTLIYDGLPVYDCPLGVIGVEYMPPLRRRRVPLDYTYKRNCFHTSHGMECEWDISGDLFYEYYQINEPVRIALNGAAKAKPAEIHFQIIAKVNKKYDSVRDIDNKYYQPSPIYYTVQKIESGEYLLVDNQENSFTYGTQITPMDKFKGIVFMTPDNAISNMDVELYLKIYMVLEPQENSMNRTPVVYTTTYNFDKIAEESSKKPFDPYSTNGGTIITYNNNCDCYTVTKEKPVVVRPKLEIRNRIIYVTLQDNLPGFITITDVSTGSIVARSIPVRDGYEVKLSYYFLIPGKTYIATLKPNMGPEVSIKFIYQ